MRGKLIFDNGDNESGCVIQPAELNSVYRSELERVLGNQFSHDVAQEIAGAVGGFRNEIASYAEMPAAGDIRKTLKRLSKIKDEVEFLAAYSNSGMAKAEVERQIYFRQKNFGGQDLENPQFAQVIRECVILAAQWFEEQHYGNRQGGRPSKESVRRDIARWSIDIWTRLGRADTAIGIDRIDGSSSPLLRWICVLIGFTENPRALNSVICPDASDIAKLTGKIGTVSPM